MNSPTWSACQQIKTKLEQTTRVVSLNSFREPTQKMNSTRPSRSLAHRIKRFCRLSVAAFFVAVLVFLGIGNGTELVSRGFRNDGFLVLVSTLGAALVYFLAYFLTLRDILGGSLPAGSASLRDRWSFFARSAAAVCITLMWLNELGDLFLKRHLVWTFVTLLLSTALIPAWVLATEEYFSLTMAERTSVPEKISLRGNSRWFGWFGPFLTKYLRGRSSVVLGSALLFASIFLPMELMGSWGQLNRPGREILSGKALEETARTFWYDFPEYCATLVGRGIYALALVLSLVAVVVVLIGKRGDKISRSRTLLITVAAVALFGIINFTMSWTLFAVFWGWPYPVELTYFVWGTLWILPITVWIWRSRKGGQSWDDTRMAVCVLQLPVVFFFLGTLPYQTVDLGYLLFLFGLQFLWWGLLTLRAGAAPLTARGSELLVIPSDDLAH